MKPRRTIGAATAPDGSRLELIEHDGDFLMMADGDVLMSTRSRHSEEALARVGCEGVGPEAKILIGGLGMGFTLRAALDILPVDARVFVVELVPEVVEWNRGPLGDAAERPLDDPRTEVVTGDVGEVLRRRKGDLDAILLDVDNGPTALVTEENSRLYSTAGLVDARRALRPGGRLAIWSADEDRGFQKRLRDLGSTTSVHRVAGRRGGGSPRHVVYSSQFP